MSDQNKRWQDQRVRIERDVALLSEAISAIALELQSAYTSYLTTLGQAVLQQLLRASYHLCTQGYPENFLSLSLNQRQQLQQAIQKLGKQAAEQLLTPTHEGDKENTEANALSTILATTERHPPQPPPDTYGGNFPFSTGGSPAPRLPLSSPTPGQEPIVGEPFGLSPTEDNPGACSPTFPPPIPDPPATLPTLPPQPLTPDSDPSQNSLQPQIPRVPTLPTQSTSQLLISTLSVSSNPRELAKWQQNLEKATHETLKNVSRKANHLLQKAGILPKQLPEQILEAAMAASEASAEIMPGPPNLLNLVVEVDHGQQSEDVGLTKIMAINLRLLEIEFADATLSSERKHIRNILGQLNKLGQEYQKKQRDLSIAEAEAAWRASWYE